ncbi:MAG TPA: GntR family transcriptional regulator [Actinomycetes bacterium]|jgi:DNA-binding GntR family transcriptional regulator|nr:GntR family transcriptional regulator [Actinomycetes bacterium]
MLAPRTLEVLRGALVGTGTGTDADILGPGSEATFGRLLNGIVSLEYGPGEMVSERELMERTGASRAALRQAVTRLSDLGLITPHARKGLVIAPLDLLDVAAVYDARLAIERAVARLAARRASREQVAALEVLSDSAAGLQGESAPAFVAQDLRLHLAIAAAGRNRYLEDALTRILPMSARLWHRLYREVGGDRRFMFQHGGIIDAIGARDPDAAEAATSAHLESARQILANAFVPLAKEEPR